METLFCDGGEAFQAQLDKVRAMNDLKPYTGAKLKRPYTADMMMRVVGIIRREANRREVDAAYSGSMIDGGAAVLRTEVDCFLAGLQGTLPERWEEFINMAELEADPEYAEYQRLKRKFEARE